MTRKNVIIRMDEELHKKIKIHVAKKGTTIQDFVLKLIKEDLENTTGEKPDGKNNRTRHSIQ